MCKEKPTKPPFGGVVECTGSHTLACIRTQGRLVEHNLLAPPPELLI